MGQTYTRPLEIAPYRPPDLALIQRDNKHLRLLSILWCVYSAFMAILSAYMFFYWNSFVTELSQSQGESGPGDLIVAFFILTAEFLSVYAAILSVLSLVVARCIKVRKGRWLAFTTSVLICPQAPFGVALAVFTFVVLTRPTVKVAFR